jgi:uncharacterized protein YegL
VTDQNLTEIIVVMDKSGSMQTIRDDAMGAFNTFLDEQKKLPGKAQLTLTLFDTVYDMVHKCAPINDVPRLNTSTYAPGGMTALLDAVGRTIDEVGKRLAATPEEKRPGKVMMVIITDGQENSSHEYKRDQIMKKIDVQTNQYQWEFVFLAAGKDAMEEARGIGIAASRIVSYDAGNAHHYARAVKCMSSNVGAYRGGASAQSIDWTAGSSASEDDKDNADSSS